MSDEHRLQLVQEPAADGEGATAPDRDVLSDAELLTACRAGDATAWDALVARYERLIFSVALRNGLSREDAADVTQSTFVALLDAILQLRDDERLAYWLMTVARRQSWRVRNRAGREFVLFEEPGAGSDLIGEWERFADLHDALVRLQSPCRDLLHALYFDASEPSYAMIAERMGRAIGGLGPLRARCLQRLRMLLGDDAPPS